MSVAEALAPVRTIHNYGTLTHEGRTLTVPEWAKELGLSHATIHARLRRGMSVAEALAPLQCPGTLTHEGRTLTVPEWAKELGIADVTIRWRLRRGRTVTEALAPSRRASGKDRHHE